MTWNDNMSNDWERVKELQGELTQEGIEELYRDLMVGSTKLRQTRVSPEVAHQPCLG